MANTKIMDLNCILPGLEPGFKVYGNAFFDDEGEPLGRRWSIGPPNTGNSKYFTGNVETLDQLEQGAMVTLKGDFGTSSNRSPAEASVMVENGLVSVTGAYTIAPVAPSSGRVEVVPLEDTEV